MGGITFGTVLFYFNIWLQLHSISKFTANVFILTENGVANIKKKKNFGCLDTCSQITLSEWKESLHIFWHSQNYVQWMHQNAYKYLPSLDLALCCSLPCPGFSPDSAGCTLIFGCCPGQGCSAGKSCCHDGEGQGMAAGWAGPGARRPWVGYTWFMH